MDGFPESDDRVQTGLTSMATPEAGFIQKVEGGARRHDSCTPEHPRHEGVRTEAQRRDEDG